MHTSDHSLTTLTHLSIPESQVNFQLLQAKCPKWRLCKRDHMRLDLRDCRFLGEGGHEICVFSFARHLRLAELKQSGQAPLWVAVGPHWSNRWHDAQGAPYSEVPLVGISRSLSDPAAFIEPLRVLAVISCTNGQFMYDEIARRVPVLSVEGAGCVSCFGNPRFRCTRTSVDTILKAAVEVIRLPCPPVTPIAPSGCDGSLVISIADLEHSLNLGTRYIESVPGDLGSGPDVVYAYTFSAFQEIAAIAGEVFYPVKIGWTARSEDCGTPIQAATVRITSQVPFPEPTRILGALACCDGRRTEMLIHDRLKDRHITAIGKEWFATNAEEIHDLMKEQLP